MNAVDYYQENAKKAVANFADQSLEIRYQMVEALNAKILKRILDLGCGAGQEMVPFLKRTAAFCIGVDISEGIGDSAKNFFQNFQIENPNGGECRVAFLQTEGERLPFVDGCFDLILCRVSLPYMNNREAIAEISRVLSFGGTLLLKAHSPLFYVSMIPKRLAKLSAAQLAYPVICLVGGTWHLISGRQPMKGFWTGKEVFQTKRYLRREFARHGMEIKGYLPDNNPQTPSMIVEKI